MCYLRASADSINQLRGCLGITLLLKKMDAYASSTTSCLSTFVRARLCVCVCVCMCMCVRVHISTRAFRPIHQMSIRALMFNYPISSDNISNTESAISHNKTLFSM